MLVGIKVYIVKKKIMKPKIRTIMTKEEREERVRKKETRVPKSQEARRNFYTKPNQKNF